MNNSPYEAILSDAQQKKWPEALTAHLEKSVEQLLDKIQECTRLLRENDIGVIASLRLVLIWEALQSLLLWVGRYKGGVEKIINIAENPGVQSVFNEFNEALKYYCQAFSLPEMPELLIANGIYDIDALMNQTAHVDRVYSLWNGMRRLSQLAVNLTHASFYQLNDNEYKPYIKNPDDSNGWILQELLEAVWHTYGSVLRKGTELPEGPVQDPIFRRMVDEYTRVLKGILNTISPDGLPAELKDFRRIDDFICLGVDASKRIDEKAGYVGESRNASFLEERVAKLANLVNQVARIKAWVEFWEDSAIDPKFLKEQCGSIYRSLERDLRDLESDFLSGLIRGEFIRCYLRILEDVKTLQEESIFSSQEGKEALQDILYLLRDEYCLTEENNLVEHQSHDGHDCRILTEDVETHLDQGMRQLLHNADNLTKHVAQSLKEGKDIIISRPLMVVWGVFEAFFGLLQYQDNQQNLREAAEHERAKEILERFNQVLKDYCEKYKLPELPELGIECLLEGREVLRYQVAYVGLIVSLWESNRYQSELKEDLIECLNEKASLEDQENKDESNLFQVIGSIVQVHGRVSYYRECIEEMPKTLCFSHSDSEVNKMIETYHKGLEEILSEKGLQALFSVTGSKRLLTSLRNIKGSSIPLLDPFDRAREEVESPSNLLTPQTKERVVLMRLPDAMQFSREKILYGEKLEFDRSIYKRLANIKNTVEWLKDFTVFWEVQGQKEGDEVFLQKVPDRLYFVLAKDLKFVSKHYPCHLFGKPLKAYYTQLLQAIQHAQASPIFSTITLKAKFNRILSLLEEVKPSARQKWTTELSWHLFQEMKQVFEKLERQIKPLKEYDESLITSGALVAGCQAFSNLLAWPLRYHVGYKAIMEVAKMEVVEKLSALQVLDSFNKWLKEYFKYYDLPEIAVLSIERIVKGVDPLGYHLAYISLICELYKVNKRLLQPDSRTSEEVSCMVGNILYSLRAIEDIPMEFSADGKELGEFCSDASVVKLNEMIGAINRKIPFGLIDINIPILQKCESSGRKKLLTSRCDRADSIYDKGKDIVKVATIINLVGKLEAFKNFWEGVEVEGPLVEEWMRDLSIELEDSLWNLSVPIFLIEQFLFARNKLLKSINTLPREPAFSKVSSWGQCSDSLMCLKNFDCSSGVEEACADSDKRWTQAFTKHLEQGMAQMIDCMQANTAFLKNDNGGNTLDFSALMVFFRLLEALLTVPGTFEEGEQHLKEVIQDKHAQAFLDDLNAILKRYCEHYGLPEFPALNIEQSVVEKDSLRYQIAYIGLIGSLWEFERFFSTIKDQDKVLSEVRKRMSQIIGSLYHYLECIEGMPIKLCSDVSCAKVNEKLKASQEILRKQNLEELLGTTRGSKLHEGFESIRERGIPLLVAEDAEEEEHLSSDMIILRFKRRIANIRLEPNVIDYDRKRSNPVIHVKQLANTVNQVKWLQDLIRYWPYERAILNSMVSESVLHDVLILHLKKEIKEMELYYPGRHFGYPRFGELRKKIARDLQSIQMDPLFCTVRARRMMNQCVFFLHPVKQGANVFKPEEWLEHLAIRMEHFLEGMRQYTKRLKKCDESMIIAQSPRVFWVVLALLVAQSLETGGNNHLRGNAHRLHAQSFLDDFNEALKEYCKKYDLPELPALNVVRALEDINAFRSQLAYVGLICELYRGRHLQRRHFGKICHAYGSLSYYLINIQHLPEEHCSYDAKTKLNEMIGEVERKLQNEVKAIHSEMLPNELRNINLRRLQQDEKVSDTVWYTKENADAALASEEKAMSKVASIGIQIRYLQDFEEYWENIGGLAGEIIDCVSKEIQANIQDLSLAGLLEEEFLYAREQLLEFVNNLPRNAIFSETAVFEKCEALFSFLEGCDAALNSKRECKDTLLEEHENELCYSSYLLRP